MSMSMNTTKMCINCCEEKEIHEFHKHKHRKDGRCSRCKSCTTKYWKENKRILLDIQNERNRCRRVNEPEYRLRKNLESKVRRIWSRREPCKSAFELLGCKNIEEYKEYLESKFEDGMNWGNKGMEGWTIDHIIPTSAFDLTDPEQVKKCFHYTNTQPMWSFDNSSKGDKYE